MAELPSQAPYKDYAQWKCHSDHLPLHVVPAKAGTQFFLAYHGDDSSQLNTRNLGSRLRGNDGLEAG